MRKNALNAGILASCLIPGFLLKALQNIYKAMWDVGHITAYDANRCAAYGFSVESTYLMTGLALWHLIYSINLSLGKAHSIHGHR